MNTNKYYIATGAKSNFFTLRNQEVRFNRAGQAYEVDVHVQNLSTDRAEAMAKAEQLLGFVVPVDPNLETVEFDRNDPTKIDPTKMLFGKYQGQSIADVAVNDPEYLVYVVEQDFIPTKAAANLPLITEVVAGQLAANKAAREAARQEQATVADEAIKAFGYEWLEDKSNNAQGFTQDVSAQLLNGKMLLERQLEILIDIYIKDVYNHRKNSKAYNAKADELEFLFDLI